MSDKDLREHVTRLVEEAVEYLTVVEYADEREDEETDA